MTWLQPLTEHEYALCRHLALIRAAVNSSSGVRDRKMAQSRDPVEIAVEGTVAEFAVCKAANAWPELDSSPRSGGADCRIRGKSIDVKAVPEERERCFIPARKKNHHVDAFVWCLVQRNRVKVLGWIKPEDIFVDRWLRKRKPEDDYCFPSSILSETMREVFS